MANSSDILYKTKYSSTLLGVFSLHDIINIPRVDYQNKGMIVKHEIYLLTFTLMAFITNSHNMPTNEGSLLCRSPGLDSGHLCFML